jgi:hypothetical protein
MQISGVILTLSPSGFVYSEFSCARAAATSFPLSKHTGGGDTASAFSGWRVYLQFTWEVGLPSSPVEFSSHHHFYKLSSPGCCACAAVPAFSGQLVYLQFREGLPSPPFGAQGALPSLLHVFFVVVAYYSVFFFSFFPGCGSVCPWGCADLAQGCLWEYHMLLSSPCGLRLPKRSGCCHQAAWEPSWFLHLTWSGDAMRRLRVWRSQSFASSRWFFL